MEQCVCSAKLAECRVLFTQYSIMSPLSHWACADGTLYVVSCSGWFICDITDYVWCVTVSVNASGTTVCIFCEILRSTMQAWTPYWKHAWQDTTTHSSGVILSGKMCYVLYYLNIFIVCVDLEGTNYGQKAGNNGREAISSDWTNYERTRGKLQVWDIHELKFPTSRKERGNQ